MSSDHDNPICAECPQRSSEEDREECALCLPFVRIQLRLEQTLERARALVEEHLPA